LGGPGHFHISLMSLAPAVTALKRNKLLRDVPSTSLVRRDVKVRKALPAREDALVQQALKVLLDGMVQLVLQVYLACEITSFAYGLSATRPR